MLSAMRVKSPFSQSALFGLMVMDMVASVGASKDKSPQSVTLDLQLFK
jgi:hypothetical protein